jgi:hypothetical protein
LGGGDVEQPTTIENELMRSSSMVVTRNTNHHRNRAHVLNFEVVVGGCDVEQPTTIENELMRSFSMVVGWWCPSRMCIRKAFPPKCSL